MLDLTVHYPDQVEADDPGYPGGKARNIVVEGDGTGTPWEEDLVNDMIIGPVQALLAAAGLEPNGEVEKVGGSQYLQAVQAIAESSRRHLSVKDARFAAVGDGTEDDYSAIVAAQAALVALGGGFLVFPPGRYRVTQAIARHPLVHYSGVPGYSTIALDDAEERLFDLSGLSFVAPIVDYGLSYEADQSNTPVGGTIWASGDAAAWIIFVECTINGEGLFVGCPLRFDHADSRVGFVRSNLYNGSANLGLQNAGRYDIDGGYFRQPPAATNSLFASKTRAHRAEFELLGATAGGSQFLVGDVVATGCTFNVTEDGATEPTYAFGITTGQIVGSGNAYKGACVPAKMNTGPAASGSRIDLKPMFTSTGASYTIGPEYAAAHFRPTSAADGPTITLSAPLFEGQALDVTIKNATGGAWESNCAFEGPVPVFGVGPLGVGSIGSARFLAVDNGSGLSWVPVGPALTYDP